MGHLLDTPTTTVDLRLMVEADNPKHYDAAVVGSAAGRSRWLSDVPDFLGGYGA